MLYALDPGAVVPVHRHRFSAETVVCLRGHLRELFYDEVGEYRRKTSPLLQRLYSWRRSTCLRPLRLSDCNCFALFNILRVTLGAFVPQGVAALTHDGLQKCYNANPRLSLPLDSEHRQVKFNCFGTVLVVDVVYEEYTLCLQSLQPCSKNQAS